MKKLLSQFILATLLVCCSLGAYAQDIITLKDGKQIKAKISDITQSEIKYKNFDYQDGPSFTINKSEVASIQYANGTMATDELKVTGTQQSEDREFWNPAKWTNQRIVGISLFADPGGFAFTGSHYGLEIRWRRLQVNGFFTWASIGALNKKCIGDLQYCDGAYNIKGYGGGFSVKWLFPIKNSGSTLHVGVINEWTNRKYLQKPYDTWNSGNLWKKSEDWATTRIGGGYSYYWPCGFYLRAGLYAIVNAWKVSHTRIYDDYYTTGYGSGVSAWGDIELSIGWEIPVLRKK